MLRPRMLLEEHILYILRLEISLFHLRTQTYANLFALFMPSIANTLSICLLYRMQHNFVVAA